MTRPEWPEIVSDIKETLRDHYPTLHLDTDSNPMRVWGIFPVKLEGKILHRYRIEITIDCDYPESAPLVWETGGTIPRDINHHIYPDDGNLCLFFPDARAWAWPVGASFLEFLTKPVNDYFLSQLHYEQEGTWPFGEMRHGVDGAYDFYAEKLETTNIDAVLCALEYLKPDKPHTRPRGHWPCYCGSGKKMRNCHFENIKELHNKVDPKNVEHWLKLLGEHRLRFIGR